MSQRLTKSVIGTEIDQIGWNETIESIDSWARSRQSKVVYICNVHSVVTARSDEEFRESLEHADMATPDGAPIAMMIRLLSGLPQPRINGPDLMWKYCGHAAATGQTMYLLGGTERTLDALNSRLSSAFPDLRIVGSYAPPFRPLTQREDDEITDRINSSGAAVVWVGLGCPKQEKWMHTHRGRVHAVMIGVGAAFDYHAGVLPRAPLWMQNFGLEWLHRLVKDPVRLWRRYLYCNTKFLLFAALQIGNYWAHANKRSRG